MGRRWFKSDFERTEHKRKAVLRKLRDDEYIPPEQVVIDLLTVFLPVIEDTIEEEAWSICYGEDADQKAKNIVKEIRRSVLVFLNKYERQLKKIGENDLAFKCQNVLSGLSEDLGKYFETNTQTTKGTEKPEE